MFGMHSDLSHDIWDELSDPPENKKNWEGYAKFGIGRNEVKDDHILFNLTTMSGDPRTGLLYGAVRNPLKNVLNGYMNIQDRKQGEVITAICVEEDWVKMKPSYLNEHFPELTKEEIEAMKQVEEEEKEEIDLGVFSDLDHSKWEKKGDVPRMKGNLGYTYQDVCRTEVDSSAEHQYIIRLCSSAGKQSSGILKHALRDALHSITKGYFKIENGTIVGMMIEEQWVEMKC